MALNLVAENDPILNKKCQEVLMPPAMPDVLSSLIEKMHVKCLEEKALGLAANQVGYSHRLFVMNFGFAKFTCINPEIISHDDEVEKSKEGCLSFKGLKLPVIRHTKIRVRYIDEHFETVETDMTGIIARCFQHELDHINGITFKSRVSRLTLGMAMEKRRKRKK